MSSHWTGSHSTGVEIGFDPALSPRNYAVVSVRRLPGADTDAAFVAALPPEAVAICDGGDPARAEQVT